MMVAFGDSYKTKAYERAHNKQGGFTMKKLNKIIAKTFAILVLLGGIGHRVYASPTTISAQSDTFCPIQQAMGIEPFAPCACSGNSRVVFVAAALVFNNQTGGSSMGQIHRGALLTITNHGTSTGRTQVRVVGGTNAQMNGWHNRTVWINFGTYACCLG